MKVIKRTRNAQEAKIIVSFLNAHDIDAELLDGAFNAVLPNVTSVRVAVPEAQEQQALRLLAEADENAARDDEETDQ